MKARSEVSTRKGGLKHYNLVMPEELFDEVQRLCEKKQTTAAEMFRKFIKLGLLVAKAEEAPGTAFLIREDGTERQVILL
jgi:hypothetical protein